MKLLRSVFLVLAVVLVSAALLGVSFAAEKMQHKDWQEVCQSKIKVLKDSAAAVQATNPDLAKGLNDLAAQKEKMMQEMMDMKAEKEAKTKLLRDSAAALQKTNPGLAEELWDMSTRKHMEKGCPMMKGGGRHMMHERAEGEEAGE
ncbi:MAG: hypothetical protein PHS37_05835 [Candidatus Omnitrophica bacterium]|nr:hypothetical protein [Candidatus Omnitrophota bacterium]